jgi:hypothetical protein
MYIVFNVMYSIECLGLKNDTGSVLFWLVLTSAVEVNDDEDEGREDGAEGSEEVGIGNEEESFEFVMLVRTNGHSLSLFDEVKSGFLVVYFELIDSFLERCLHR